MSRRAETDGAPVTFPDWLTHRATTAPSHIALVAEGRSWSFAELDHDATQMACALRDRGVASGDRVATLLRNGAAPAVLVHAVLRLGATLVPLNTRLSGAELAWQLGDAAPSVLLVEPRTAELAALAGTTANSPRVIDVRDLAAAAKQDAPHAASLRLQHPADDVLAIIYTSGTTGRPKGAMLTVANFWWSAIGSALNLGTLSSDRWLACLPLFHVGGLSILLRSAIYGITAVVHDGFDEHAVNRSLDAGDASIVSVVAATLQRMLDAHGDTPYPSSLRCVLLGGGPAPRPLLERCAALGVPVVQTYGLTETTSQLATISPVDALRKLGSAGRALYPNVVRIGDPDADGIGEILARGPVVMAGYRNREEDTARALRDSWLHTGDVGRLDDEGFLYVLDRRDDLIITGGENVYPAEVEAALLAHGMVSEAGVVGMPDERWGQRVVAVVSLAPNAGSRNEVEAALTAHCRAMLASYKVPREFRIASAPLPRTASGKLQRSLLRGSLPEN